jgi:uncharacterized delta-60 repeat protein
MRRLGLCVTLIALFGTLSESAWAAPGDVDLSFGPGGLGYTVMDFAGPGGADFANGVAVQPDGKIVLAGQSNASGNYDFAVARLTSTQGLPDTTYGTGNGKSVTNISGSDFGYDVALQADGKIVVAGTSASDFSVARLNPLGTLDTSYGLGTGASIMDFGGNDTGRDVELQPDDKILVAGTTVTAGGGDFAVARLLNPQGTFDTSYGPGATGKSVTDMGTSSNDIANGMALQSDGKILVAGSTTVGANSDFALLRLTNPGGVPDPGFRLGTGKAISDLGGSDEAAQAVLQQPDGKILEAGYTNSGGTRDFVVVRLTSPQGVLDSTFGSGTGKVLANFGGLDTASSMALQPDGKIVVAGYTNVGGTHDFAVARFLSNGTLDTSFGSGGKSIFSLGGQDDAYDVALQPDGKILLAGYTSAGNGNDFAVARFIGGEPTGYARPKGATPINVSLVPTYTQCTSSNRTHGPALAFPSCSPPTQQSSNLTVGTPDANGAAANSAGSVILQTLVGAPGPPDDSDVSVSLQMTDVRCKAGVSTCGPANAGGGADYTGELYVLLGVSGRMTDKFNDATGSAGASEIGTVQDFTFNGGEALCSATASAAVGATCTLTTTANTVLPGTVKDGNRAIWQLNSAIFVTDGGPDGDANSLPNQTFATQGIFVP